MRFLRRKLQLADHESVFCYVNSCFAPGLDEGVGNLWRVSVLDITRHYQPRLITQTVLQGWR